MNKYICIYIYTYTSICDIYDMWYVCVWECEYASFCLCVCLGILTPGFTYTSSEVKDYPDSLGMTCGQHVESPSRCYFMDRVAIQIPHNAELAPIIFEKKCRIKSQNAFLMCGWKFDEPDVAPSVIQQYK